MARYARAEVIIIAALGVALAALTGYFWGAWALLPALLAAALLAFYRDPRRTPPPGDDLLLAPADGHVIRIERDLPGAVGGPPEWRIVIFLSVFDVHVNRSPCAGQVVSIAYTPGKFLNALRSEATDANERNTLVISPQPPIPGPISVRQIAGVLARRIVCAARPGDILASGQRFGMIKLGSQTELRGPEASNLRVEARIGQKVRGGLTILARFAPQG